MSRLLLMLCILVWATSSYAAPTQWTVAEGGNGHWYEAVLMPEGVTWDNANLAATAAGGAENDYAFGLVNGNTAFWFFAPECLHMEGPWLGGAQNLGAAEPSGGWRWTNADPWTYAKWGPGEPSNGGGVEDRLQFFGYDRQMMSYWNDYAQNGVVRYGGTTVLPYGYIVEYNVVPEPSGVLALASGLGGLGVLWRRRR